MSSSKTVVVSGAGSGIGRAVARRLVSDGFHVTAVGRRKEPRMADVALRKVVRVPARERQRDAAASGFAVRSSRGVR
jgi:NAD(P)-dependent dehydrogenase (short-subunit alcohol dehydrogenase family)